MSFPVQPCSSVNKTRLNKFDWYKSCRKIIVFALSLTYIVFIFGVIVSYPKVGLTLTLKLWSKQLLFNDIGRDSTTEASVFSRWNTIVGFEKLKLEPKFFRLIIFDLDPVFFSSVLVFFGSLMESQFGVVISTSMSYLILQTLLDLDSLKFNLTLRGFLLSASI